MAYWISSSVVPFDDTLTITTLIGLNSVTTGVSNTKPIDGFRQGVELNTVDKFFISTQPKLWGGSIKFDGKVSHLNETYTYGQAVSFAEFFGKSQFDDRLKKFDSTLYINLGGSYPFPLFFNEGPQQQEENVVEPITIPFRKNSPEYVGYLAKGIHGSLEDGQDDKFFGTTPISHFFEYGVPLKTMPFLDQGEQRLGDAFSGSVIIPGYVSMEKTKIRPYNDQDPEILIIETSGSKKSSTILPYCQKSAAAGGDVYGPNQGKYGTDSITFRNRIRGS